MTDIQEIAEKIACLSYDDMMEIAGTFSEWTGVDAEGNETEPTVSKELFAALLSDWAQENLPPE